MRIAFVCDAAFPWRKGGLEAVERTEAEQLAKHHEVHFFSMRWPGMKKDFTDKGIHYHTYHSTNEEKFYRHGRRSVRGAFVFSLNLWKLFAYRFDVLEANMFPIIHIPLVKFYCRVTGCKMILDVVEVWDKNYWTSYLGPVFGRLGYWYTNYFLDSANAYIANSTATRRRLVAKGINKNMITVFAPILDDALLDKVRGERPKKELRVIYWGRFIKEKRIDKWLEVVKAVNKRMPKAKGILIGDGPERDAIRRAVKDMDLEKVVEVRSGISENEPLFREVAKSSVLLHMSEREGLGIVALESLSLGVPVVLPDYTPIPKEVKDMCVVAKEEDIADKLVEILKSKDKGKFLGDTGALRDYYISNVTPKYGQIFGRLGLK